MENNNIAEAQWEHHLEYNDEMLQRRAGFIAGYNRALSLAYDWIMAEAYAFMPKEKAEELRSMGYPDAADMITMRF